MATPSLDHIRELFRAGRDRAFLEAAIGTAPTTRVHGKTLRSRLYDARRFILSQTDALLRQAVKSGESAKAVAVKVGQFFDPRLASATNRIGQLVRTGARRILGVAPARGGSASWPVRRIVRQEIREAHSRAMGWTAARNPFAVGIQWRLAPLHREHDACDGYASLDRYGMGAGVFRPSDHGLIPQHAGCVCSWETVYGDTSDTVRALREMFLR